MFFLGSLLLVLALAALCGLLGRALLAVARPGSSSSDPGLEQALGCALLMLAAGALSRAGLPMAPWGAVAVLLLAAAAGLTLARRRGAGTPGGGSLPIGVIGGCGALLALLSLMRDNAFNPYGDAIASISLGEYLQAHPFGRAVAPIVQSPVAGIVALYQRTGYRMGPHYLLALVQACAPHARNIDVFPAVSAYGVLLASLACHTAARRLGAAPRRAALAAALLATGGFSLAKYSADYGIMNQLFGIAFMVAALAELARLTAARDPGPARRWLPPAVLAAGLVSAYSELLPMLALSALLLLALRARHLARAPGAFARALAVTAAAAAVLANGELLRAWTSLRLQSANRSVGSHIAYTPLQFAGSWLGVFPGPSDLGYYREAGLHPALLALHRALFAAVLLAAVIGLLRALRRRARIAGAPLLAPLAVFAGLYLYFALLQTNPFLPGVRGNSWALSKLTMYAAPYGAALVALALAAAPRFARGLLPASALAALLYLPAHDRLSYRRTEFARLMTGDRAAPFDQYAALPAAVDRLAGAGAVRFRIPPDTPCFHIELAAYYLYPRPIAADHWRDSLCMYLGPYEGVGYSPPPGPYALTIAPAAEPGEGGEALPAGFRAITDPGELRIDFKAGWGVREYGKEGWWHWAKGEGELSLFSPASRRVMLRASAGCVQPGAALHWTLDDREVGVTACTGGTLLSPELPLAAGENRLRLTALAPGAAEPAPFLLRDLAVAPTAASATPGA